MKPSVFKIDRTIAPPLLLAMVIGVAVFLRTYSIDTVPPGLYHDVAVNGLDTLDVLHGKMPIFFERNNGREPLFIYLQAVSVYLLGNNAVAMALPAVVVGVLTVWATYLLAREWFGFRVGLLSAAGIAVSFWHLAPSRLPLRAIMVPFFLLLILYFLWKGFRGGRMRDFVAAGALGGLSQYTYTSARFIPVLILAILLAQFLANRREVLAQWRGLSVAVVVAAIVFAPLGAYFVAHPDSFFARIDQVSIFNETPSIPVPPMTFGQSVLGAAGMFFVSGDQNWRHNLPGRPVFDPIAGALFTLGFVLTLVNVRRRPDELLLLPRRRLGLAGSQTTTGSTAVETAQPRLLPTAWLALWFGITLLPDILSHESPNFLRLTALAPAVFIMEALGIGAVWTVLRQKLPARGDAICATLAAALMIGDGAATFHDYFDVWAKEPNVYYAHDANLVQAVHFLDELDGGTVAYPNMFFYVNRSPTIRFLAPRYYDGNWVREDTNFAILPPDPSLPTYYLVAPTSLKGVIPTYFPDAEVYRRPIGPGGREEFTVYCVSPAEMAAAETPRQPLGITFGNELELVGATPTAGNSSVRPGSTVSVNLLWRVMSPTDHEYSFFVHMTDQKGRQWGQKDLLGLKVEGWHPGDLILTHHEIEVPADAPPIPYELEAGVTYKRTGERLRPATGEAGNVVKIASLLVVRDGTQLVSATPSPQHALDRELVPGLEVLGYDAGAEKVKPGESLGIDLLWQLALKMKVDVMPELVLVDSRGNVIARQEGVPAYGQYPFSKWGAGDVVRDPRSIALPAQAPAGLAQLKLVARNASTGEEIGELPLMEVTVEDRPRNFALPTFQHKMEVDFGDQIRLLGFDLNPDALALDQELDLVLYWQATSTPAKNYTVFTHLLDSANTVVGQKDNQPVQGTYPTSGWLPNEVVKDQYRIRLTERPASNSVLLEIGLYDASTGKRLTIDGGAEDRVILGTIKVED